MERGLVRGLELEVGQGVRGRGAKDASAAGCHRVLVMVWVSGLGLRVSGLGAQRVQHCLVLVVRYKWSLG